MDFTTINGFIDKIFAQFDGLMGVIGAIFGGISDLAAAPAVAAGGASSFAAGIQTIKDQLIEAFGSFSK